MLRHIGAAAFAALFVFGQSSAARAQDISLESLDGSITLEGTFLGFDGEFYRIDTQYGELTVDSSGVNCKGPACPDLTNYVADLTISGAGAIGEVMWGALIESFAHRAGYVPVREPQENGDYQIILTEKTSGREVARFYVHMTSTDEGFADLLANEADMVLATREIRDAEASRALEVGLGDLRARRQAQVIALDALVPVVAPGHPVLRIGLDDLSLILQGKITDWSELDGPEAPISVHLPDLASGLGQAVHDQLLTGKASFAAGAIYHASPRDLATAVAADPFALGIASFSDLGNAEPMALQGECGFVLRASRKAIKAEDYPLVAPMFLYRPARRLPKVGRAFVAYLASPAAQQVVRRSGYVDQAPEQIGLAGQGDRLVNAITNAGEEIDLAALKEMIEVLGPRRRLTTSFRFQAGSTTLDPQSLSNLDLLAQAIGTGLYDAQDILIAGFSDGMGDAPTNRRLSAERADVVLEAIREAAAEESSDLSQVSFGAIGFGEAMPMACDDAEWGRDVNRRVEVWLQVAD